MENLKKILVVEDETSISKVLCKVLTDSNFNVISAENGKDGLDMALNEHPDLILLDLQMPIMDGLTMLHELRNDPWGKTSAVFILTNNDEVDKATEAIQAGAYAYLIKSSWRLADVIKKIREKLGITS